MTTRANDIVPPRLKAMCQGIYKTTTKRDACKRKELIRIVVVLKEALHAQLHVAACVHAIYFA